MKSQYQRGFSLLELIVTLAIVSLVSAALFQSAGAWLRLSARASAAAEESLSSIAAQRMFDRVVGGLIYAWPEQTALRFVGAEDGFAGLSATPLHGVSPQLLAVQLAVQPGNDENPGRIIYSANGVNAWTLRRFDGAAVFSYLGADGEWRTAWPPAANPEPGPFDDAVYFQTPQLPLAVRIDVSASDGQETWIADISSDPLIPQRIQDLREQSRQP